LRAKYRAEKERKPCPRRNQQRRRKKKRKNGKKRKRNLRKKSGRVMLKCATSGQILMEEQSCLRIDSVETAVIVTCARAQ